MSHPFSLCSARPARRIEILWFLLLAVLVAGSWGCSGEGSRSQLAPSDTTFVDGGAAQPRPRVPCAVEGATQECTVTLARHGDVVSCFKGEQTCVEGTWSDCGGGSSFQVRSPVSGVRLQSHVPPGPCVDNPCDPTCRQFDDMPEGGVGEYSDGGAPPPAIDLPPGYEWPGGSSFNYPPAYLDLGLKASCTIESDCQFNTRCVGPALWNCAHSVCEQGAALEPDCNDCATAICDVLPFCCSDSWDQPCVDAVASVCRSECHDSRHDGVCTPWFPSLTDPVCAGGFDLAVGLTCHDGTEGYIPICNHGGEQAPAGIKVVFTPPVATDFKSENPGSATPCTVTTPWNIRSGECASLEISHCPGIETGSGIMVNPRDGTEHTGECSFADNWSIYAPAPCRPPVCSGNSATASLRPVNMMVLYDRSGSMGRGSPKRWDLTNSALKSFFADPESAGLRVALRYFPTFSGNSSVYCNRDSYRTPNVGFAELIAPFRPEDQQEQALFDSLDSTTPQGWTPMLAALGGVYDHLRERQAADPRAVHVVALVTDGEPAPSSCGGSNDIPTISNLVAEAFNNDGIRTYAIGIEDISEGSLNQIAAAGGGEAWFVSTSNPNYSAEIVGALNEIATQSVSCTADLPNLGAFDPETARVVYFAGDGAGTGVFQPHCQLGQVQYGNSCYAHVAFPEADQNAAREVCLGIGSGWDLVTIASQAENEFVYGELTSGLSSGPVWIGINDRAVEGQFEWTSGQCAGGYTAWAPGEPDNEGACGNPEDAECARLRPDGFWDDRDCEVPTTDGPRVVCEMPHPDAGANCGPGEVQDSEGFCWAYMPAEIISHQGARQNCQAHGPLWELARIDSQAQNDFAASLVGCGEEVRIEYPAGYSRWAPGQPDGSSGFTDCPVIHANGYWTDEDCTADIPTPYLCKQAQAPEPPSCLGGTVPYGGSCYWKNSSGNRSWGDANAVCENFGGHLVAINSAAENERIRQLLGGDSEAWIGYYEASPEGQNDCGSGCATIIKPGTTWSWAGTARGCPGSYGGGFGFDTFASGEPNNGGNCSSNWYSCSRPTQEDHAVIWSGGGWNDDRGGRSKRYVCEFPPSGPQGRCASGQLEGPDELCYRVGAAARTFDAARADCQATGTGWDLVSIENDELQSWVAGLHARQVAGGGGCGINGEDMWIGYRRDGDGLPWYWVNGAAGTPSAEFTWASGFPGTPNCATIRLDGYWRTRGCAEERRYICKGPLTLPPAPDDPPDCPDGWAYFGGHCYQDMGGSQTPSDGCPAPSYPVTIRSDTENAFVASLGEPPSTLTVTLNPVGLGTVRQSDNNNWTTHYLAGRVGSSGNTLRQYFVFDLSEVSTAGTLTSATLSAVNTAGTGRSCLTSENSQDCNSCWYDSCCSSSNRTWRLWQSALTPENVDQLLAGQNPAVFDALASGTTYASVSNFHDWNPQTVALNADGRAAINAALQALPDANGQKRFWMSGTRAFSEGTNNRYNFGCADSTDPTQDVTLTLELSFPSTVWLGIERSGDGWQWKNGACMSFTQWREDGCEADCARMSTGGGLWSDEACVSDTSEFSSQRFAYVCEGPLRSARGRCGDGEREGPDGRCYVFSDAALGRDQAQAECEARGPGWGLAALESPEELAFAAGYVDCYDAWVQTASGLSEDPGSGLCVRLLDNGVVQSGGCSSQAGTGYLCEGPQAVPDLPEGAEELTEVPGGAAGCGAGDNEWYYDDPDNPTAIELCPSTCERIQEDRGAKLGIEISCWPDEEPEPGPPPDDVVLTHVYTATCEQAGQAPQWGLLNYSTLTPGSSTVEFAVRTAASEAELSGDFVVVATAGAGDPSVCERPDCVIDLYEPLGIPENQRAVLELRVTLRATAADEVPEVESWRLQHSCPFVE